MCAIQLAASTYLSIPIQAWHSSFLFEGQGSGIVGHSCVRLRSLYGVQRKDSGVCLIFLPIRAEWGHGSL